jgi:hypothetical protein
MSMAQKNAFYFFGVKGKFIEILGFLLFASLKLTAVQKYFVPSSHKKMA